MALTTATVSPSQTHRQPGSLGARRARLVTITGTAGYDSATGMTLTAASVGLSEIYAVIPCGSANTGATVAVSFLAAGVANIVLWNGTTLVATSSQAATTILVLVIGI